MLPLLLKRNAPEKFIVTFSLPYRQDDICKFACAVLSSIRYILFLSLRKVPANFSHHFRSTERHHDQTNVQHITIQLKTTQSSNIFLNCAISINIIYCFLVTIITYSCSKMNFSRLFNSTGKLNN